ncbi:MAG: chloride channel protein [Paracoccaceae bacterium]|nr:chloride channel protein [Paracoccaceae bacterium]
MTLAAALTWAVTLSVRECVIALNLVLFSGLTTLDTPRSMGVLFAVLVGSGFLRKWLGIGPVWVHEVGHGLPGVWKPIEPAAYGFGFGFRKAISTILTVGPGWAGGIAAPMVLTANAFGSAAARLAGIKPPAIERASRLVAIAAMGTTLFHAPIAGALFAMETVRREKIELKDALCCAMGALVAFSLSHLFLAEPDVAVSFSVSLGVNDYFIAAGIAVFVAGPIALIFTSILVLVRELSAHLTPGARILIGAFGSVATTAALWGTFDLHPEYVLGMAHLTLIDVFQPDGLATGPVSLLLALLLGRMALVAFSVSSGGSVGLFTPAAFFGAVSGALVGRILEATAWTPPSDPRLLFVTGMAAALAALLRTPLTAIALMVEIFGFDVFGPVALTCLVTFFISTTFPFYRVYRREVTSVN